MSAAPIFVLGNPRSGTTLLRISIGSHPNIMMAPECGFMLWLQPRFTSFPYANPTTAAIEQFVDELIECRKFSTWELSKSELVHWLSNKSYANYAALSAEVYKLYLQTNKPDAQRWGDKNNFHMQHVNELAALFPTASFIHIVRDVRDVLCSYRTINKNPSNSPFAPKVSDVAIDAAIEWQSNVQAVQASFSALPAKQWFHVRYEDLVSNPNAVLQDVCNHINEPFNEEMLNFHKKDLEPASTMDWKQLTKSPITKKQVGRYKEELNAEDIAAIQGVCSKELLLFGYKLVAS